MCNNHNYMLTAFAQHDSVLLSLQPDQTQCSSRASTHIIGTLQCLHSKTGHCQQGVEGGLVRGRLSIAASPDSTPAELGCAVAVLHFPSQPQ